MAVDSYLLCHTKIWLDKNDHAMSSKLLQRTRRLHTTTFAVFLFWTLSIAGLVSWTILIEEKHAVEYAQMEARANFNKDIALRNWVTKRGGIYVPVSESTPPNPHLAHIVDRDLVTPEGKSLTLMNPAYMLRQTMDEYSELYGIKGRITSLKPLNPDNAPDEWERKVLDMFDEGVKEYSEFTTIDGKPFLRYMQTFITSEGCLKCHAHQGYKVGDVRGGVGVSVPIDPYLKVKDKTIQTVTLSYGVVWLLGTVGIGFGNNFSHKRIQKQHIAELALIHEKEKAEQLSELDGLTGIYNRRHLDMHLPTEVRRAARERYSLGVLMLDIDWFKSYNDTQGHLAGDEALKTVARTLQHTVNRPADVVTRYGGEEFCILLPETDEQGVRDIGEKLCMAVESMKIATRAKNAGEFITISVGGVYMVPSCDTRPEWLITQADEALFEAKRLGKNRVVVHCGKGALTQP
ncbi:diguanylate cyclase [Vibrio sp. HN007]|uniref:diguanylate cyclase n=1 Tax=Vibrio iocasae TaxID=3098914 RepID=UPI0035D4CB86